MSTAVAGGAAAAASTGAVVVYVTVPSRDVGRKIADSLVESKLAACVNIIPGEVLCPLPPRMWHPVPDQPWQLAWWIAGTECEHYAIFHSAGEAGTKLSLQQCLLCASDGALEHSINLAG